MVALGGGAVAYERGSPVHLYRCRADMAQIRQSRPDSSFGSQAKSTKTFQGLLSSLESESKCHPGFNPRANRWFLRSTPVQMPPEPGGIKLRFAPGLPPGWWEIKLRFAPGLPPGWWETKLTFAPGLAPGWCTVWVGVAALFEHLGLGDDGPALHGDPHLPRKLTCQLMCEP